ncbi:hypothetical protein [Mesorhizobium sp.]|uniref:hypothetical protein n=1 Tax=Mesorhizobium sp. TaxID=1871066 RepID=UPI00121019CE|nr:hypothetical protein [Mesorhizobium sp.]TIQ99500.1 MAG: hypothetical protein E5X36_08960 [Mesorhizobium sp.]TIU13361.1 MAG: hypothetical protein E5W44_03690 [Mesorhizobium sp.]
MSENITAPADGGALPSASLTRRAALGALASLSALGGATAAIAAVPVGTAPDKSARERFDFHLAEMQKAAAEIDQNVRFTQCVVNLGQPDKPLALFIVGQWAKGRYQGDGIYAGGTDWRESDRYNVKLLDAKVGGERGFSVIKVGEKDRRQWMTMSEQSFEAFIGEKVQP